MTEKGESLRIQKKQGLIKNGRRGSGWRGNSDGTNDDKMDEWTVRERGHVTLGRLRRGETTVTRVPWKGIEYWKRIRIMTNWKDVIDYDNRWNDNCKCRRHYDQTGRRKKEWWIGIKGKDLQNRIILELFTQIN